MSLFWQYFQKTLAWPWIFRPNALCILVKGLALYMDTVRDDIIWMRNQWIVPLAEQDAMENYGLSRGAPRTQYDDDARHRNRIERAFSWHKLGGTILGLPQILTEYGYADGEALNKFYEDEDLWAHFDIKLLSIPPTGFSEDDVYAVQSLANEYKPARSVLSDIGFAQRNHAPLQVGAILTSTIVIEHAVATGKADFVPIPLIAGAANIQYVLISREVA